MVLLMMLMEIALPKMGELLVMMMTMISPSGREVPPAESLRRRAKVLLPKFRFEMAALHPESPIHKRTSTRSIYHGLIITREPSIKVLDNIFS